MNRHERRAARHVSTRQFKVEVEPGCDLPPDIIGELADQFCKGHPTLPRGVGGMALLRTSRGGYKIDALADMRVIRISGPYSDEGFAVFEDLTKKYAIKTSESEWNSAERVPWPVPVARWTTRSVGTP